jgi:voltage-gated potassium channel
MNRAGPKYSMLAAIEKKIELPMLILSFVWFCILITELVYGMNRVLYFAGSGVWILFVLYFIMRLGTAPSRVSYLKKNWLFGLAMLVSVLRFFPFLNSFSVVRAVTATLGIQVIWILASADQGMRSLRRKLGRRGVGYAIAFTVVVIFGGAAGMLNSERSSSDPESIHTYQRALWWTSMQMTNIGTAYSPRTTAGRFFCLVISVYAAAMFGYLTALLATLFIGRDAKDPKSEIPSQRSIQEVQEELVRLRLSIERAMGPRSEQSSAEATPTLSKSDPNR